MKLGEKEMFCALSLNETLLTKSSSSNEGEKNVSDISWRFGRPALVVSCTSWTDDEDISILLDAVSIYDAEIDSGKRTKLPDLCLCITGKGPNLRFYRELIARMKLRHVHIYTLWLEIEDYPRLLGSADIGVSLHFSSSKLDLPMKVVDMFGCGLPVCSLYYDTIKELIEPSKTGILFENAEELATQLKVSRNL